MWLTPICQVSQVIPAFIFGEEVNGCSGLWLNIALSKKNATARNLTDNTLQSFHFPILFIFYKEILKARKLGCSACHCSFNSRAKNMELPVHRVRRRKMFSNTAGVLNWPSFSISIDFPTVYIDFLNILSKVGTYVTPIGFLFRWWYVALSTQKTKREIFTFLVQSMPCLFHWPLQPRTWP